MRLASLGVLLVAASVAAEVLARQGFDVDLIRLEGRVGVRDPNRKGPADLDLQWDDTRVRLQVSRARVLRGNRLGEDFLAEIAPYEPSLFLQGDEALLERLRHAKPGDRVAVTGYHRTGSRTFEVSAVDAMPAEGKTS
jgi:hypothetical protein